MSIREWLAEAGINADVLKTMDPCIRILGSGLYEASVGLGFETCWWPEAVGATKEEAIINLNNVLAGI